MSKKHTHEQTFLVTDGCIWEKNKQEGTRRPHAIEVVDTQTGEVRYIRSGSIIKFLEGMIGPTRTQESYNKMKK